MIEGIFGETARADILIIELDIKTEGLHIIVVIASRVGTEQIDLITGRL